jgi:hypothetical protein
VDSAKPSRDALFDLIVAENGGLLFDPKAGEETLLGDRMRNNGQ